MTAESTPVPFPELPAAGGLALMRRQQILRAATEVFAERGFHASRVADIARKAQVAHGLIYHYFDSKDEVLRCIFEENWTVFLNALTEIAARPTTATEKLAAIAEMIVDVLRIAPATVQVIIREISRSSRFAQQDQQRAFQEAFAVLHQILESGQTSGELKADVDPLVMSHLFFGALETLCTGAVLGVLPSRTEEDAERLRHTVREVLLRGFRAPRSDR